MLQHPMAAIVVCVDWAQVGNYGFSGQPRALHRRGHRGGDLLLAAHSIGLGAGPVTSFSRMALATILNLPLECVPS